MTPAAMPTDTLSYLQFYPTLRCNFACSFCFNKGLAGPADVAVKDFETMADKAVDLGVGYIDMLGGEPTLHPGLTDIVDRISAAGLKTTISTNGSDAARLVGLSERFDRDAVRIGVSINEGGVSAALHDYIVRYRPMVKSIFPKSGRVPESCAPYIGQPGIQYFLLYRDVADRRELSESVAFYDFDEAIKRLQSRYCGLDGVFCSGFVPDVESAPVLDSVRCPAGTTKLSVLPDGSVYPCYLLFHFPQFKLGNILTDAFQKIWQHPVLDHFRRFEKNRCPKTECRLFASCHGGCPAMSFRFYNDLSGPDPRCM
ncbi:MAG: SPASM domain-containing protein [Thermodesulfobacteriota bacterium]